MKNPYQNIAAKYKLVDLQTRIAVASPYELINLLIQGAHTHAVKAIGCMEAEHIKAAGEHISKALDIVNELRRALDLQQGGEVAQNLLIFYNQIETIIVQSNIKQDKNLLIQASELLKQLQEVWQSLKPN